MTRHPLPRDVGQTAPVGSPHLPDDPADLVGSRSSADRTISGSGFWRVRCALGSPSLRGGEAAILAAFLAGVAGCCLESEAALQSPTHPGGSVRRQRKPLRLHRFDRDGWEPCQEALAAQRAAAGAAGAGLPGLVARADPVQDHPHPQVATEVADQVPEIDFLIRRKEDGRGPTDLPHLGAPRIGLLPQGGRNPWKKRSALRPGQLPPGPRDAPRIRSTMLDGLVHASRLSRASRRAAPQPPPAAGETPPPADRAFRGQARDRGPYPRGSPIRPSPEVPAAPPAGGNGL